MAKLPFWTLLAILLISYALLPSVQTFINNLIGIGPKTDTSVNELLKDSSEEPIRCSNDNLSESQFLMYSIILPIAIIIGFYAVYQYHKKHKKGEKNGRSKKGINKD